MREAQRLASQRWPTYISRFSRHEFTLPQLFACLVVREMLRLSYRKAEQLVGDCENWLRDVGLRRAPDHNTLWRGMGVIPRTRPANRMLDLLAETANI